MDTSLSCTYTLKCHNRMIITTMPWHLIFISIQTVPHSLLLYSFQHQTCTRGGLQPSETPMARYHFLLIHQNLKWHAILHKNNTIYHTLQESLPVAYLFFLIVTSANTSIKARLHWHCLKLFFILMSIQCCLSILLSVFQVTVTVVVVVRQMQAYTTTYHKMCNSSTVHLCCLFKISLSQSMTGINYQFLTFTELFVEHLRSVTSTWCPR